MFLHSGASLHGHEYSNRPASQHPPPINRRSPLLRAAFATTPVSRSNTTADGTRPPVRPPHRRQLSENISPRRTPEPVVRFQEPAAEVESPKPEPMSEDEASYSASEASYLSDTTAAASATPRLRRKRRSPRKSTTYLFAHPAPKLRTKKQLPIPIHIRPRLLLQLQQLSLDRRPRPVIDVFPSSLITGGVVAPRFHKKFPRLFGVKGELGLHDIILVRSEDYGPHSLDTDSDGDEDSLEHRQLVGVVSPLRRDARAEIVLVDGSVWVAIPMATGSYEFVHLDEHGNTTTARWVRRTVVKPASSPANPEAASPLSSGHLAPSATSPEYKFTFSIINPQSRRHPIMGTLTKSTLEVLDYYTTISQSSGRYPPSRPFSRSVATPSTPTPAPRADVLSPPASPSVRTNDDDDTPSSIPTPMSPVGDRTTFPVEDALKDLMSITAVWVVLRQGWATNYKAPVASGEATSLSPACQAAATTSLAIVSSAMPGRLGSLRRNRSPKSEDGQSQPPEPRGRSSTSDAVDVRGSRLLPLGKGSTMPVQSDREHSPASSIANPRLSGLPRRATSTGAAFVHHRMQNQMSDVSDSEKAAVPAASKGRRVLSGDWSPWAKRSPALVELATGGGGGVHDSAITSPTSPIPDIRPSPSVRQPVSSVTAPVPPAAFSNGRRAVSAYYPSTPGPTGYHNDLPEMRGASASLTEDESLDVGGKTVDRASGGARWKRFNNWLRRLGAH